MKKFYIFTLLGVLFPALASAHVKWFVDADKVIAESHNLSPFYSWTSKEVLIWSAIVFLVVIAFGLIDSWIKTPKKLLAFGLQHEKQINRIAQVILGVFLITVSFVWKLILAPDLPVTDTITSALQILQALIGVMYILNIKPRLASLGLVAFCLGLGLHSGLLTLLENAILLALGLYFFIVNSPTDSRTSRMFFKHGIEIVRIGTGITLITLAFTEKILYPELSLEFLAIHNWNFMAPLFPWFSDKLFVLSTGFAELIFGILFILGYLTRTTTILIALFFAASVTTMLAQRGLWEVEDLVVYSAAILFIFFGHGRTKFFHRNLIPENK